MLRHVLIVSAALAALNTAKAQSPGPEIPVYDPMATCRAMQQRAGDDSQFLLRGCLTNEQSAYDLLKSSWPSTPADSRQRCITMAGRSGQPSYFLLRGCIVNEETARQQNQQFQFRR